MITVIIIMGPFSVTQLYNVVATHTHTHHRILKAGHIRAKNIYVRCYFQYRRKTADLSRLKM